MAFSFGDILNKALPYIGSAVGTAVAGPAGAMIGPAIGAIGNGLFSAAAVERERAWSEKMYNKYNSPAALVRQYQDAGINPALMFGQSAIPAPTTSTAAVAPENPFGDMVGVLGSLMQLDLLDANKEGIRAEARYKNALSSHSEYNLELDRQFAEFERSYSLSEMIARINKLESEVSLNDNELRVLAPLRAALLSAQEKGESAKAAIDKWRADYMNKYDSDPSAPVQNQAMTSLLEYLNSPERFWNKNPNRRKKNRD